MSVLNSIIDGVRADLAEREARISLSECKKRAQDASPALPFLPVEEFGLICEVKRSSPSKGHLADISNPAELASQYEAGGALAISVLTEQRRFNGSLDDLDAVRAAVNIPILRKDFTVTEYQIYEARAHGADLVLLMASALDDTQLKDFYALSNDLGMTALVETHTPEEMERVRALDAGLIGVNARNLKDLSVDTARVAPIMSEAPQGATLVAESGVESVEDIRTYVAAGAHVVLCGEALVKAGDPRASVEEFTRAGRQ